jgi:hypothetical protein
MNVNLGITPQTQAQQDLYRLAYHCAYSHSTVKCNMCPTCTYNAHNYGWDTNEVNLIKARALIDYHEHVARQKQEVKSYWATELGITAGVIILILFLVICMRFMDRVSNVPQPPATIQEATQIVRNNLRDVNFDDKINCIDYAVIFYETYPDSKIIRVWDNQELNHLLNQVGDQYIEPQVRSGDPTILWPTFNSAYKKDETIRWSYWATRRRW